MPKGQENVDKIIEICREMISALDKLSPDGKVDVEKASEQINNITVGLEDISGKFFLKSNPSVPPTTDCLKRAAALLDMLQTYEHGQDSTNIRTGLDNFIKAFESLAEKASMRSTVIT
jgi:hypothetical protein